LGLGEALQFDTKSNSVARDLFYIYNAIGRFHAAHTGSGSQDNRDYITYHALGKAILLTRTLDEVAAFTRITDHVPRQSVVLIDEIDKAPRDFPNDILNELEDLCFRVPELNNVEVRANPALRPIVVITSNSEKNLPDAFLRRCVYYHISFPDRQRLEDIVVSHLAGRLQGQDDLMAESLNLFTLLRSQSAGLRKKPATAELLGWISAICTLQGADPRRKVTLDDLAIQTLGILAKTPEDREAARVVLREWFESRKAKPS
jgi:MoxR-like ATPase